jgi:Tetrapyrrole (Corrin/Porphyrin) Methylases
LLHVAAVPLASTWLDGLHENARSLAPLYDSGGTRIEIYSRMADEIVAPARAGRRVCAAFYGNAGIFGRPGHTAIRRARAEGIPARMLPAVSAQDCLVADLGVDPGDYGWMSYDATDFLLHRRPIDAACALVLWQIGVVGETGAVTNPRYRHLDLVAERISAVHGADHGVFVYEASPYPVAEAMVERVRVVDLPSAAMTPLATLYVPPATAPSVDGATAERLGLALRS